MAFQGLDPDLRVIEASTNHFSFINHNKQSQQHMVDKRSAPAFSIGHSKSTSKYPTDFVPGPGAYQPSITNKSKVTNNAKTTEERFRERTSSVPGPGTYNSPKAHDHIPTALILSRNKEHKPELAPGPGAYEPNYRKVVKSESGFKIGHSEKIADIVGAAKKLPGPGNYEVNTSTVIKDHAVKIGSEKRSQIVLNKFTPGPGQYKQVAPEEVALRNVPRVIFGKSGRSLSTYNITPGPGTYAYTDKLQESVNKSKGFSMSSKHPDKALLPDKIPGPGSYNTDELDKLKHKIVSFSVGKSAKLKIQNQKELLSHPGPEKYNYKLTTFDAKTNVFGKEKRPTLANEKNIPGPGSYNAKLQNTLPQFSIPKSSLTSIKPSSTPGPGSYEPKIIDTNEYNSIKLAKDERRPFYDEKKGVPGPGSYNHASVVESSPAFKIGNEKRGEKVGKHVPGPGNYDIPSTISNLPKFSK